VPDCFVVLVLVLLTVQNDMTNIVTRYEPQYISMTVQSRENGSLNFYAAFLLLLLESVILPRVILLMNVLDKILFWQCNRFLIKNF